MTGAKEQALQPSPLERLRQRVLQFPARREEVKRLDTLRQIVQLVTESRVQVERVRAQRGHMAQVFVDCDRSASAQALQQVHSRAEALERTLSSGPQAWDNDTRRPVQELKRAVESATTTVQREWNSEVADVVNKYERLGSALQRAGMTDGKAISDALARIRRIAEPPMLETDARRAAEAVRSVAPAVARLGVSGPIGEFLVAASEGSATARSLRDPAVIKFLDENHIWDLLKVSIR